MLSNLFLLIPAVTYTIFNRIWRAAVFYIETFVSGAYHLCLGFNVCIFSYDVLKFWDFFFAQSIILLSGLYLVDFPEKYEYIEWILIIIGEGAIIILQLSLPGELYVQAGLVLVIALGVIIYWIIYAATVGRGKLPKYDWTMLSLGVSFMALSVCLFATQQVMPSLYWLTHSLWHISAAVGQYFFCQIKPAARKYASAASRIYFNK